MTPSVTADGETTVVVDEATDRQCVRQSVPVVSISACMPPFMPKIDIPTIVENANKRETIRTDSNARFMGKV